MLLFLRDGFLYKIRSIFGESQDRLFYLNVFLDFTNNFLIKYDQIYGQLFFSKYKKSVMKFIGSKKAPPPPLRSFPKNSSELLRDALPK